uniref:FMRFa-like peptide 12 n=2 Tax=Ascaris TaxID=6251 RepID=Q5ENY8_ASCSU|nr:FMRFamide-related peptide precursor [Ascaris suum]ADI99987.1 FMRFa-like peptide precursor 12 [Ascaris suum]
MFSLKAIVMIALVVICTFCISESRRFHDDDFSRQFLFRGIDEPLKNYMRLREARILSKRVPSAADMMIRFGKRSFIEQDME